MALEVFLVEDLAMLVVDASVAMELVPKELDELVIDGVKESNMALLELG